MKHLKALNKYFWKYRWRFILGIVFIVLSNYFRILTPQLTGFVIDNVQVELTEQLDTAGIAAIQQKMAIKEDRYDLLVKRFIANVGSRELSFTSTVLLSGISMLVLALLGGFFMFLMRQTIIVMSRHIEFAQKNEVFRHYLKLDTNFYKQHSTGDLMNRISEDVSRVRMYTGPALMYFINLAATIGFSVYFMYSTQKLLTLYVLAPLPLLAVAIYFVNTIIHKRSEKIQSLLSDLTTNAQESYSGIRVIKSFVQEKAMRFFFNKNSEDYKKNAIGLAKMEAIYFPSMSLLIGLSTLLTIMMGGLYSIRSEHGVTIGTIAEFVMYVNMLTFPVSAIGWTASMIQRAAASQKRLNEFLHTKPTIESPAQAVVPSIQGNIRFRNVNFTYPNTGIEAVKDFDLDIKKGQKIAIVGHTGSGKTTIAQLLLRMYDTTSGIVEIDGVPVQRLDLNELRKQVSYVPQDVFLFSDTVAGNIAFGVERVETDAVKRAAAGAYVEQEILGFSNQYETMIGERGVTLSGGQKQRISIARALIKEPRIVIFDDCLSAVDTKTEKEILSQLNRFLDGKTALIITHRILSYIHFDQIIVLDEGRIVERGTHKELISQKGYYSVLYQQQGRENENGQPV
ncbi:MAG: ABC transporter ATP-binding protein [Chitinophagaceae bacterium]|nr:ABC transporter ATP-binding protein [Chitinophagaceae bacterium]